MRTPPAWYQDAFFFVLHISAFFYTGIYLISAFFIRRFGVFLITLQGFLLFNQDIPVLLCHHLHIQIFITRIFIILILHPCNLLFPAKGNTLNCTRKWNFLFWRPCKINLFDIVPPLKLQNITGIFLYNSNNLVMIFLWFENLFFYRDLFFLINCPCNFIPYSNNIINSILQFLQVIAIHCAMLC